MNLKVEFLSSRDKNNSRSVITLPYFSLWFLRCLTLVRWQDSLPRFERDLLLTLFDSGLFTSQLTMPTLYADICQPKVPGSGPLEIVKFYSPLFLTKLTETHSRDCLSRDCFDVSLQDLHLPSRGPRFGAPRNREILLAPFFEKIGTDSLARLLK